MVLREIAHETNLDDIKKKTSANYKVSNELKRF